jgi:hypothetical protein
MQVHILPAYLYSGDGLSPNSEEPVAFKPNYGRDRAERARAARARSDEKKRKRDEKTALRKAQRTEAEPPTDGTSTSPDEKQS